MKEARGWPRYLPSLIAAGIVFLTLMLAWGLFFSNAEFRAVLFLSGIVIVAAAVLATFLIQRTRERTEELEQLTARLSALHDITAAASSLDLQEVLRQGLVKTLELMRLDAGEVRLLNKDGRTLNLAVSQGANSEFLAEEQTVGVGECACGPANDEVSVVTVQDSFRDPRVTRPACQRQGYRGVVCIPLKAKGKALGILEMHSREPLQLNARDLAILTAIGDQLGLAIENAQLYNDMERRVADLSEKVQHLAIVQERERISREMHDGLAQALGLLNLRVRMVERLLAAKQLDQAQAELGQMEAIIDDTYADVREGITDLRLAVPQGQGFIAMLQEYVEQFGRRNRLATEFRVGNGQCPVHLSPIQEVQLIRIVQEALSNVRKHARARKVWVTLTPHPCPPPLAEEGEGRGRLTVHVQDDGVGFDPQEAQQRAGRNFGLAIMEERAEDLGGTFTLETRPGSGTTVTVEIPYEARRDESDADPPGR